MCQYEHGFIIMQQETTYNIHLTTWSAFHRQKSNAKRNNKKNKKNTQRLYDPSNTKHYLHILLWFTSLDQTP